MGRRELRRGRRRATLRGGWRVKNPARAALRARFLRKSPGIGRFLRPARMRGGGFAESSGVFLHPGRTIAESLSLFLHPGWELFFPFSTSPQGGRGKT